VNLYQRISRGETTIDFVGNWRLWAKISGVFLAISLIALVTRQLNFGLEFEGGVAVQAENAAGADLEEIRDALATIGLEGARVLLLDDGTDVRVQTAPLDADIEQDLVETIADVTGTDPADNSRESVGPTFGALVARQALIALGVFLAAAALFITVRLEWRMAGAALIALVHDLAITIGVYAITGFEVTPATVVALLTILGYSLYDTVVVFDKVEELEHELTKEVTYSGLVNRSMNMVLARSLNTSLTSLLPVGSLLFVGSILLGASSLKDFALALFVGIASGTYSSVFVAAPLLGLWKEREPEWIEHRERIERRAAGLTTAVPRRPGTSAPPATPRPSSGAAPRPPKKRPR
jgi:preprotein translocase subunit SecF